jgi:hypothetical protein
MGTPFMPWWGWGVAGVVGVGAVALMARGGGRPKYASHHGLAALLSDGSTFIPGTTSFRVKCKEGRIVGTGLMIVKANGDIVACVDTLPPHHAGPIREKDVKGGCKRFGNPESAYAWMKSEAEKVDC